MSITTLTKYDHEKGQRIYLQDFKKRRYRWTANAREAMNLDQAEAKRLKNEMRNRNTIIITVEI